MYLRDNQKEEEFRQRFRTWIEKYLTDTWRQRYNTLTGSLWLELLKHWQRDQHEAGFAVRSWPRLYGGQDADVSEDLIIFDELAQADAPNDIFRIGTRIIAPMLMTLAREDQKQRFLPRIGNGSDLWSQGFSEPGAGSDLAALSTKAVYRNGKYMINGQKIWNSFGHLADICLVLTRTNAALPKHKGLTAFAIPLKTPGITIAPIRQMNFRQDFNEIFFEDVEVDEGSVIGAIDGGWKVAVTMLDFERRGISTVGFGCRRLYARLLELARSTRIKGTAHFAIDDPNLCWRLARLGVQAQIGVLNNHRFAAMVPKGGVPGAEASIQKLHATELNKAMNALAFEIAGLADLTKAPASKNFASWQQDYLTSFAGGIAGGTSQIQRNIIAERLLQLPR